AFGQGLLQSGLQDHRGQVPHGLAPSEATRSRQNIVHVALMRNMSSRNVTAPLAVESYCVNSGVLQFMHMF
ncbi:hypothetical protein, partial [Tabrizicola sp.]|uniref:hypothetical protein n=1 Tax=Tabrizicola sp. TaxID=2005166 RepID=UPI003F349B8F